MFSPNNYQSVACLNCTMEHVQARDYLHVHHATVTKTAICTRGEVFVENSRVHCLSGVGDIYMENSSVNIVMLNVKERQVGKLTLVNSVVEKALLIGAENPNNSVLVDLTAIRNDQPKNRILICYSNGNYTVERIECGLLNRA